MTGQTVEHMEGHMRHDPAHLYYHGPPSPGISGDYFELSEAMLVRKLNKLRESAVRNVPSLLGPIEQRPPTNLTDDDCNKTGDSVSESAEAEDPNAVFLSPLSDANGTVSSHPDPLSVAVSLGAAAGAAAKSDEEYGNFEHLVKGISQIKVQHLVPDSILMGPMKNTKQINSSSLKRNETSSSSVAAVDAVGIPALGNGQPTDGPSKTSWQGKEISIVSPINLSPSAEKNEYYGNNTSSLSRPYKLEIRLTSSATSNSLTSGEEEVRDLKILRAATADSDVTSVTASMSSGSKSRLTPPSPLLRSKREENSLLALYEEDEEEEDSDSLQQLLLPIPLRRSSVIKEISFSTLDEKDEEEYGAYSSSYIEAEMKKKPALTSLDSEERDEEDNVKNSAVTPSEFEKNEKQADCDNPVKKNSLIAGDRPMLGRRVSLRLSRKSERRKSHLNELAKQTFSEDIVSEGNSDSNTPPLTPLSCSDSPNSQSASASFGTPICSNLMKHKRSTRSWKLGGRKKNSLIENIPVRPGKHKISTDTIIKLKEQQDILLSNLSEELYVTLADDNDFDDFIKLNKISMQGDFLLGRMLRERTRIQLKRDMLQNDKEMYMTVHCEITSGGEGAILLKSTDTVSEEREERQGMLDDRSCFFSI